MSTAGKGGRFRRGVLRKHAVFAARIAIGSCCAVGLAEAMHLNYATSAGTITLLTILSTKWGTVRLAWNRIVTFCMTVVLSWLIFGHLSGDWIPFGIFMLTLVFLSHLFGWGNTISVNAVIGTHFLSGHQFGIEAIFNELCLVLIGVTVSIVINLFYDYRGMRSRIIQDMRAVEDQIRAILALMADVLLQRASDADIHEKISALQEYLEEALQRTWDYQDNTFVSHPEYYIRYIDMRLCQCGTLRSLYYKMEQIGTMPQQAQRIAEFMLYLTAYIEEMNVPTRQLKSLHAMREGYRAEPLPATRAEFESRALLFHVMMDLEEFLLYKKDFVDRLDMTHKSIYWEK